MNYELVAKFSTDIPDDEEVVEDIKSMVETILPYMVDNVDVHIRQTQELHAL